VDPKVRRVFPCGEYPSKRSPPRQPGHAVTAPRSFELGRVHRLACPLAVRDESARVSPRRAFHPSTSGPSSTEESVAAT
jgi:hypothetical protein